MDTMPLKSLEYAATAPSRFASSLRLGSNQLEPHSKESFYLIDQGIRHNGFLPEYLRRFELIPGGRYLLSEHKCPPSDDTQAILDVFDSVRILLWDLQAPTPATSASSLP